MTEPDPIDYPATQFQDSGDEYVSWTPPPVIVMPPEQATDLAERTLAKIPKRNRYYFSSQDCDKWDADRERVASDLAGLLQHHESVSGYGPTCAWCPFPGYPCPDAARYADGLVRTASLYGVTL